MKKSLEERLAAATISHKAAVVVDPKTLPRRIDVVKKSSSQNGLTKGEVIAFRDSHSELKYTVSVSVSVVGQIAEEGDLAVFDDAVQQFLNDIQDEVRKDFK